MTFTHVVVARVYEHIEPIDRGERYEDTLHERAGLAHRAERAGRRSTWKGHVELARASHAQAAVMTRLLLSAK